MSFLSLLGHIVQRYGWVCHAYCLMGSHYHLLVQTPEANLGTGMCDLNGGHARGYNSRHGRRGALFGGRFRSTLITKESHLLEAARYVVLNPVRAGLCQWPWDWPWSSFAATEGRADRPDFLQTEWILGHFGSGDPGASYLAFVLEGLGAPPPH
ncbi:MAG: transposase [Thermoleophilia bacterium]|nr:transposase [Thermoleophilia bacterium]